MTYMMDKYTEFDETISLLKKLIEDEADLKMQSAGIDTSIVKARVKKL